MAVPAAYRTYLVDDRRTLGEMALDGQRQRNALTAAEKALAALASGDAARATRNAATAAELDQIGVFAALPEAVAAAASDLAAAGTVGEGARTLLRAALPAGPLKGLVAALPS